MPVASTRTGALVGALLTLPLFAAQFLIEQLYALTFAPFGLFDWLARALPGDLITLGIDSMLRVIRLLDLGETSSSAKRLEQLMAVALLAGVNIGAAALLYRWLSRRPGRSGLGPGLLVGAAVGGLAALAGFGVAPAAPAAAWTVASYLAWGAVLGWAWNRLVAIATASAVPVAVAPAGAAAGAEAEAPKALGRREFLVKLGAASATLTVLGGGAGAYLLEQRKKAPLALPEGLPTAVRATGTPAPTAAAATGAPAGSTAVATDAAAAVEPAPGTRLDYTAIADHYRIDINTRAPQVDLEAWRLVVDGLVDRPLRLTYQDLVSRPAVDQTITLSCISNEIGGDLISTTRWTGVPLRVLLDEAGVQPEAVQLRITAADGFDESLDVDLASGDERVMLAWAMDGQPLTPDHGFPVRIYIPDRYGMKQPKWIERLEAIPARHEGYWVSRGWDKDAIVRTTAVVDAVAAHALVEGGPQPLVPIGGIAYGGAKGISKVEVQVDDGPWEPARLRAPLSDLTWVLWRHDWPFAAGRHTVRVRATNGQGELQITAVNEPRPSGATGIHELKADL